MTRVHETGLLWNGDTYNISSRYGHFMLEINGKFYCSGDSMAEIRGEIEELEKQARKEKIAQLN